MTLLTLDDATLAEILQDFFRRARNIRFDFLPWANLSGFPLQRPTAAGFLVLRSDPG